MQRTSLLLIACGLGGAYLGCTQDFGAFSPDGAATGSGGAGPTSTSTSASTSASTSTATTTSGTSTATTGGAGGGTTGAGGSCAADGDCDDGNPCTADTCDVMGGTCSSSPVPDGPTPGVGDAPGDCTDDVCIGGTSQTVDDDGETPDDGNACTSDSCSGGSPQFVDVPQGTPCGAGGICDGSGVCGGCNTDGDCPGPDDDCQHPNCNNGTCETVFEPDGTIVQSGQTMGDCHTLRCDGMGGIEDTINNNDVPPSDNNACTSNTCANGVPYPPAPAGTNCANGGECDGMGNCVECLVDADCSAPETCGGGGTPNQCGCTPESMMTTCAGKECGSVANNCGSAVSCGMCMAPLVCSPTNVCCTSEPASTTCAGKCGMVANNCGVMVSCTPLCVAPNFCVLAVCQ